MDKKHIEWIDSLKGYGIFLVTFGHLNPALLIETHIYSFHMCLFFFISGFLFKQRDPLKIFVTKKFKSIMVPFLVWNTLSLLLSYVLGRKPSIILEELFVIRGNLCWNATIWFLLVLFMTEVLFAFIMKVNNSKYTKMLILLISIVLWAFIGDLALTLKLNLIPLALFFYALGNIVHSEFDDKPLPKGYIIGIIIVLGILSVVFGAFLNLRVSYTSGRFGNIYFFIIAAIAGTMLYYLIFKNLVGGRFKILEIAGQNSLIIMASQYWFFKVYDMFSKPYLGFSMWHECSTIKAFIVAVVTMTLIILIVSAFKRLFRNNKKILDIAKYAGIR